MQVTALLLAVATAVASTQVVRVDMNSYGCTEIGGNYCAGRSLRSNIIIHCNGTSPRLANCFSNLASVPPVGHKVNALSSKVSSSSSLGYESSPTAGDAACSLNGIAYPDGDEAPFFINGTKPAGPIKGTNIATSTASMTTMAASETGLIGRALSTLIVYVTEETLVPTSTIVEDLVTSVSSISMPACARERYGSTVTVHVISTKTKSSTTTVTVQVTSTKTKLATMTTTSYPTVMITVPTLSEVELLEELPTMTTTAYPTATLHLASGGLVVVPSGTVEPRPKEQTGVAVSLNPRVWVVRAVLISAAAFMLL